MNADQAHPRSRGENRPRTDDWGNPSGSSPLTRGKPDRLQRREQAPGLIPAHAGKTPPRPRRSSHRRAHPRSRGENPPASLPGSGMGGSSPLTRGKRGVHDGQYSEARLIPAHAGKTPWVTRTVVQPTAHPRSRGENKLGRVSVGVQSGSSPLTRGKPGAAWLACAASGLIPAHAGKTNEKSFPVPVVPGSSPLTRGKRVGRTARAILRRLIPAHAGKTRKVSPGTSGTTAHPRSRGENPTLAAKSPM